MEEGGQGLARAGVPVGGGAALLAAVPDLPPGRARGVFARVPIPKHTYVGKYTGEPLTNAALTERYGPGGLAEYTLCMNGVNVDAADAVTAMRLINDYRGLALGPNVAFVDDFMVVAIRDLKAGEELLVDYGDEYFVK